jgi:uncharacterized protein (DUF1501 family)
MKTNNLKRREFMKLLAKGGATGALASVGQLGMMQEAAAADPGFSDYKALVCLFFLGGNDGFNMLVPSDASHEDYQAIRAALAVQKNDLGLSSISAAMHGGTMPTGAGNLYNINNRQETAYTKGFYDLSPKGINLGVNGVMPEFAQLVMDNKMSIIANSGNMVAPVTREQIQNKTANLPQFLFAHNHQQRALQTGQANNLTDIGWAGKIADSWKGINNNSSLGLNISYSGNNRMLIGNQTSPLVLSPGTPPTLYEMAALRSTHYDQRRNMFKELIELGKQSNPYQRLSASLLDRSITNFDALNAAWKDNDVSYTSKGPYGEGLFEAPSASMLGFGNSMSKSLISRFETIAKMVDIGAKNAFNTGQYNRQVFFVGIGGFDTHAAQATGHSMRLREISLGLWKFQKAMEELGHAEKVTTFSMSDFGRTMSINAGLGTDHAWGSHHFVMGGAGNNAAGSLKGGQMIGTLPDLKPGSDDDYSDKGRIIPTTSQDQINATICDWFGVDKSLISTIFPNLSNFETTLGDADSAYLNDLFV